MVKDSAGDSRTPDWQQPAIEQQGLKRFIQTLRERVWVIVATAVAVLAVAGLYVLTSEEVYEAETDVLITPIPADDNSLDGLGLVTESFDPTLDIQTAVQLIDTRAVADRAAQLLGGELDAEEILDQTDVEPVGQSNVVAVVARQPSAEAAAELADTFAEAAVEQRDAELDAKIDEILPTLQAQADAAPAELTPEYTERLVALQSIRETGDPTIAVQNAATPPESAAAPRRTLILALAAFGGIVLGVALAFALQLLDPRLRREDQLRELYRLPILTRIPVERRSRKHALPWQRLSSGAIEGYRTLRATITSSARDAEPPRSFMVTGAGPSEGKTTTAINLATSLAIAGARVIVIEGDLRRPAIAEAFGITPQRGVVGVLLGQIKLEEGLVAATDYGDNLQLLLAEQSGPSLAELFSLPPAGRLVEEARQLADYVVVDSPPPTEVIDALPLASDVDKVVMVVRLGKTRLARLKELGELLAGSGIRPAGFAIIGVPREGGYYYYQEASKERMRPRSGRRGDSRGRTLAGRPLPSGKAPAGDEDVSRRRSSKALE